MKKLRGCNILLIGIIVVSFLLSIFLSVRVENSFWLDRIVLAIPFPSKYEEILKMLKNSGYSDVLCMTTQPYWYWDFDGLKHIPLAEVEGRFLSGDPRRSDYAEKISVLFQGSGNNTRFDLYYLKTVSETSNSDIFPLIRRNYPGSTVVFPGAMEFSLVISVFFIIAAFPLILMSKNKIVAVFFSINPFVLSFLNSGNFLISFFIFIFFLALDHYFGDDIQYILTHGNLKNRIKKSKRLFSSNFWQLIYLIPCIPVFFENPSRIALFSLIFLMNASFFIVYKLFFVSRIKIPLFSFKPITISNAALKISITNFRFFIPCVFFSFTMFLYGFLEPRLIPTESNQNHSERLSIPLPKGYSSSQKKIFVWQDFNLHLHNQAAIQYQKIGNEPNDLIFTDFFYEKSGVRHTEKKISDIVNPGMAKDVYGIENMIRENCGSLSPIIGDSIPKKNEPYGTIFVLCISLIALLKVFSINTRKKELHQNEGEIIDGIQKTA